MNVSRNWPSAIIGRITGSPSRPAAAGASIGPAAAGPSRLSVPDRCRLSGRSVRLQPDRALHRLGNVPAYVVGSGSVVAGALVRRRRLELQLRRRAAAERVAERPANHLVDVRLIAEAHLRLRRVDVHVDRRRRHRDEQVHLGAALLDRRDAVGVDDGVRDGAVLDDPPVDEDVLRAARRPLLGQRRDVAQHLDVARVAAHLDEIVPLAVQLVEPIAQRARPADTAPPCGRRSSA